MKHFVHYGDKILYAMAPLFVVIEFVSYFTLILTPFYVLVDWLVPPHFQSLAYAPVMTWIIISMSRFYQLQPWCGACNAHWSGENELSPPRPFEADRWK